MMKPKVMANKHKKLTTHTEIDTFDGYNYI